MRLRHNKKRNTAFLFEILAKEAAKALYCKDKERVNLIKTIIGENFNASTILGKELKLYKVIYETNGLDLYTADKLIQETKLEHDKLDKKQIFNAQTKLIRQVNEKLGQDVFSNFVPNYKSVATISQIFNFSSGPKEKVLLERKVVQNLTRVYKESEKETLKPMDELVYSTFVKKFNQKYESLLEEQKKLLYTYVMSVNDNGLQLRVFLNEELYRLREGVVSRLDEIQLNENDMLTSKMKGVINRMDSYRGIPITESLIQEIMKIQELVKELESNGD